MHILVLVWVTALFGLWAADQLLPRAWYDNAVWLTVVWVVSLLGGVAPPLLLLLMWLRRSEVSR